MTTTIDAELIDPPAANMEAKKQRKRPPPPKKRKGQLARTTQQAVKLSAQYDIPEAQAFQIVTGKTPDPRTVDRMSQEVAKWSLRHPVALRSASKTIKQFAAGKTVNGIKPKCSTVSACATRIVDASDPVVKRTESLNVNLDMEICPVDLGKLFNR